MLAGLRVLPAQTARVLLLARGRGAPPLTVPAPMRARFATRGALDVLVAAPWVPIFALLPGAVLLFSSVASLAPALLPSTFRVARALHGRPFQFYCNNNPVAAAAARAPPLTPRLAVDAHFAAVAASLPAPGALAAALGLPQDSLGAYNEGLQLDDALLADEEALGVGAFGEGRAAELREAARARLLPVAPPAGEAELRAALRQWLELRRALPPLALLHAMAVGGARENKT
jgi:hypothetical protein